MYSRIWAITLLVTCSSAIPQVFPRQNQVPSDIQVLIDDIPKYDPNTRYDEITEWLAIGDSYSAGISADIPNDELNWRCSRFKRSYPAQMHYSTKFPGNPATRLTTFGACSGDKMDDVVSDQIELGKSNGGNFPKIGNPQIVTVSMSGNDLGFGDIVNNCLYHWIGYHDCERYMKAAKDALEDPDKALYYRISKTLYKILSRVRATEHKQQVQMFVTGYIRFWNETNPQCNNVTWSSKAWDSAPQQNLTTELRTNMNRMVLQLNALIKEAVDEANNSVGGVWFVDEFETAFDGHRFCEHQEDPNYHKAPIDDKTWFIHYLSPYANPVAGEPPCGGEDNPCPSPLPSSEKPEFFKRIDAALIPPKNGVSTEDQIKAAGGNYTMLNPAYENYDSMTRALIQLVEDPEVRPLPFPSPPIGWLRIMHPKGFGYEKMADAVISKFISVQAATISTPPPPPPPPPAPTKELLIYYDNYIDEITNDWHYAFFESPPQSSIDPCNKPTLQVGAPGGGDTKNPPKPNGSWKMKIFGQDDCEYANDGTGAGTIKCPDMGEPKPCLGAQDNRELKCIGAWADWYYEVARCLW